MTSQPSGQPASDIHVDQSLLERLVGEARPDLADLPVRIVDEGWDFVIARLGDDMAVRAPRRTLASDRALHADRFLSGLHGLSLPVPTTVHLGLPTPWFPHHWRIVRWIDGVPLAEHPVDPSEAADALGRFVAALHRPAPDFAVHNPDRSITLAERRAQAVGELQQMTALETSEIDVAISVLDRAAALTPPTPTWIHGDLHPRNILARDGQLAGVIDFSDVMRGDPAIDAQIAFAVLPLPHHPAFRAAAAHLDDEAWLRARGWAIALAAWLFVDDPADLPMASLMVDAIRRASTDHPDG